MLYFFVVANDMFVTCTQFVYVKYYSIGAL
jgi:hypothetical protein